MILFRVIAIVVCTKLFTLKYAREINISQHDFDYKAETS